MVLYKRLRKIKWIHKTTNEEILKRMGEEREIWNCNRKQKVKTAEHILRHDNIARTIIEGHIKKNIYMVEREEIDLH